MSLHRENCRSIIFVDIGYVTRVEFVFPCNSTNLVWFQFWLRALRDAYGP